MSRYPNEETARFDQQFAETEMERNDRLRQKRLRDATYSTKPVPGPNNLASLSAALRARADEIDHRLGPIPGHIADAIACELRRAADALEIKP